MSGCVTDSATVDLTVLNGVLSADAKISGAPGNTLVEEPDGLYATGAPAGAVTFFAGAAAPAGWLLCDGGSYLRADYSGLFAVIGVQYGFADGTHFNVPDLRGRVPVGLNAANPDVDVLGESDGLAPPNRSPLHNTSSASLTVTGAPGKGSLAVSPDPHDHTIPASPQGTVVGGSPNAWLNGGSSTTDPTSLSIVGAPDAGTLDVGGTGGPGGSRPTDTPAFLVLNGIIKT